MNPRQQGKPAPKGPKKPNRHSKNKPKTNASKALGISRTSRSQAIRASRRAHDDAHQITSKYLDATHSKPKKGRANKIDDSAKLKIIGLGGMDGGGSKNMVVVEYENEAIVIDAGNDLSVDLPGINYGIADTTYLDEIKHKLKAWVITHGHLDHIGALPYVLPKLPAPVYGSRFTIGRVEEILENADYKVDGFELETVTMNQDNHEKLKIGKHFAVELVRVTHSIPGSTLIVLDTPVGKVINTGDFKIDPEPLDHHPTDLKRLKELGKEGVHVLLSESTTTERPGRTPTESIIEPSFVDIIKTAPGRVFVGVFSTNTNRIQMIVNAAVEHGRKIALDGRSMMSTLEMAVNHGFVKIPKGTFVPMASVNGLKNDEVVIIATGSQGEPNSALVRMSKGDHRHINMKPQDTVVLSSTPIPESGNDAHVGELVDNLLRMNVHVYQHITHEIDGVGPLHVSGHSSMEEIGEMIDMLKPKFFMPIYGPFRSKKRHIDIAVEHGIPRENCYNAENGEVVQFSKTKMIPNGTVANGTVLVDNTGAIVSNVVVKDRLMLAQEGVVTVILTISKKSGKLISSPDIITRGFIYMRENEELMDNFRKELRRVVGQRYGRVDLDRFKQELKDHVTYYLFGETQRSPMVIPVVNVVGSRSEVHDQKKRQSERLSEASHD